MTPRESTIRRADRRIDALIGSLESALDAFESGNPFGGPSVHFHERTLHVLAEHGSAKRASRDPEYAELLYATLTAWGMHRMGTASTTRLVDFPSFRANLIRLADAIESVESERIEALTMVGAAEVGARLWDAIAAAEFGVSDARLVVGSKVVHHLLPGLLPPIDREYTEAFFFGSDGAFSSGQFQKSEAEAFELIFPRFAKLARAAEPSVRPRLGEGMHTSVTKVIDNAIVGFMLLARGK